MKTLRYLVAFAALSALAVSGASAQLPGIPERQYVLVVPEATTFLCSAPSDEDAEAIPPEAVARVFRFGMPVTTFMTTWPREITVVFDSSGQTLMLLDDVTIYGENDLSVGIEGVAAVFADGQVVGTITRAGIDTVGLNAAVAEGGLEKALANLPPPVTRELSIAEKEQVKLLGEWLWKRRCPAEAPKVVSPSRDG